MIKINLLPVEKRRSERTPLPRFFLIVSTAAVAAILLGYNALVYVQIRGVEADTLNQKTHLNTLIQDVAKHDRLVAEMTLLDTKVQEIKNLVGRDVDYWRAVNALWDVIHANPKVWIDDIKVVDSRTAQAELKRGDPESNEAPPYAVTMKCYVIGDDVTEMTRFRSALKEHVVLQETLSTVNFNVDWKVDEDKQAGGNNPYSISFAVSLFGPTTKPKWKTAAAAPTGAIR